MRVESIATDTWGRISILISGHADDKEWGTHVVNGVPVLMKGRWYFWLPSSANAVVSDFKLGVEGMHEGCYTISPDQAKELKDTMTTLNMKASMTYPLVQPLDVDIEYKA
jgi:hypothetical protein